MKKEEILGRFALVTMLAEVIESACNYISTMEVDGNKTHAQPDFVATATSRIYHMGIMIRNIIIYYMIALYTCVVALQLGSKP